MLTLQLLETTTGYATGRENDGSDDYSLVYAPGAFEKENPSDHALRVWFSAEASEYHLWLSEDFDGDRRGLEEYFIRVYENDEDALKLLHEDIEEYLAILS